MAAKINFTIGRGETFTKRIAFGTRPVRFLAVTELSPQPPATFKAQGHALLPGWPVALVTAPWALGLGAKKVPAPADYRPITVVDEDHVAFDGVNSAGWEYSPGAYLQAYSPYPLAGKSAALTIRSGNSELLRLTESDGLTLEDGFVSILLSTTQTATLSRYSAQFELTVSEGERVTLLAYGDMKWEA